jgi:hypothetical protein
VQPVRGAGAFFGQVVAPFRQQPQHDAVALGADRVQSTVVLGDHRHRRSVDGVGLTGVAVVEQRAPGCRLGGSVDPSAAQANPGRRPAARPLLVALASGFGRRAAQAVDDPAEQEGQEAHGQQRDARHDLEVER